MPSRKNKQQKRGRGPRKQTQKKSTAMVHRGPNTGMAMEFCRSLADPFEHEGVRLGWGCLVPSSVASAYLRTSVTANADGSLAIFAAPNSKNLLNINNAGAAVATWTAQDATDAAATAANFSSGRCISIGIKAFPSIAATTAPGASFAGALEGVTFTSALGLTPNDLEAFPQTQVGIASNGATATGRPIDVESFRFQPAIVNATGLVGGDIMPFSIPYICFEGLPAGATVFVEVVMNFEGLALTVHSSAGLGIGETVAETLASSWASFEQVWGYIRPMLGSPSRNTVASVADMIGRFGGAASTLGAYAMRAAPQLGFTRRLMIGN